MAFAGSRRANTRGVPTSNLGNSNINFVMATYLVHFCGYGNTIAGYMRDIQEAQRMGIDGFVLDMMGWGYGGANAAFADFSALIFYFFQAAKNLGTGFRLCFMHDMKPFSYGQPGADAAGQMLSLYANHPNYFWLQGRPVMSAYDGNVDSTVGSASDLYWSPIVASTVAAGFNVFFLPIFDSSTLSPPGSSGGVAAYASSLETWFGTSSWLPGKVQGILNWNWYVPQKYNWYNSAYATAMSVEGVYFTSAVAPFVSQLRFISTGAAQAINSMEYYGGEGIASLWMDIINTIHPTLAHVATWNDLTESYMAPYPVSDLTVNNLSSWQMTPDFLNNHAAYAELNKYYCQWFKSGAQPVWPDAMYIFYRTGAQALVPSARPAGQSITWNAQSVAPTLDDLFITTILTAPATLTVTTGGTPNVSTPGAGVTHTRVAFATGAQVFDLSRSGSSIITITGANVVSSETLYYNVNPVTYFGYA